MRAGSAAEWLQLVALLALLCLFYFVIIPAGIEDPADMGLDEGMPPSFSARAAAIVAVLIIIGRMVQLVLTTGSTGGTTDGQDLPAAESASDDAVALTGRVFAGIGAALLYAYVLLPQVGFIAGSLILLVCLLLMLGERQPVRVAVLPVLVTLGVWLLFVQALGVTLPTGALFESLMAG